jgi:pantetheine-phosphate adenylyltransferase
MSLMNRKLNNNINTIFLMPHEKYTYISSSIVKEVFSLKGNIDEYVPKSVLEALKNKHE